MGTDCTGSCKSKYHMITTPHWSKHTAKLQIIQILLCQLYNRMSTLHVYVLKCNAFFFQKYKYTIIFRPNKIIPIFYTHKIYLLSTLFLTVERNNSRYLRFLFIWKQYYINYQHRKCDKVFSLNIFYLPIKQTKWIRHKLNKLMKSSPNYNMLQ